LNTLRFYISGSRKRQLTQDADESQKKNETIWEDLMEN
jgi:hypothetical protein